MNRILVWNWKGGWGRGQRRGAATDEAQAQKLQPIIIIFMESSLCLDDFFIVAVVVVTSLGEQVGFRSCSPIWRAQKGGVACGEGREEALPLCHCFRFDSDLTGKLAFNCFSLTNKADGRAGRGGGRNGTRGETDNCSK